MILTIHSFVLSPNTLYTAIQNAKRNQSMDGQILILSFQNEEIEMMIITVLTLTN